MKIIVGLGNPGSVYQGSRHNIGFALVDSLSTVLGCQQFNKRKKFNALVCKQGNLLFVKPQTFMNGSGFTVKAVTDFYLTKTEADLRNLFIIHDDLDLILGSYKIKYGTGPATHNGLLSIYQHLGSKNFWHVRIGVDTRNGERKISSPVYVLQKFNSLEQEKLRLVEEKVIRELTVKLKTDA